MKPDIWSREETIERPSIERLRDSSLQNNISVKESKSYEKLYDAVRSYMHL